MRSDTLKLAVLVVAASVACSSGGSSPASADRPEDSTTPAADAGALDAGQASGSGGGADSAAADGVAPPDAAHPEDAGGGLWVYYAGSFNWPLSNDYSYAVTSVSYSDATGAPLSGTKNIKVVTQPFGGWQPAAGVPLTHTNWDQDVTGMKHLTFALKPTGANQKWKLFFHKVGDLLVYDSTGNGETVDVNSGAYGPADPPANQWSVYKVPLADVLTDWDAGGTRGAGPPVLLTHVYKFAIADATGVGQTWFVDNVGFVP